MPNIASIERLRRISLMAAMVVPVLTACGGGSGGSAEAPVAPGPAPAPAQPATLTLLAGNTDGAGSQDGPATTAARFGTDSLAIAIANSGDVVISDRGNNLVRKLSANQGQVVTLAGGGRPQYLGFGPYESADGNGAAARINAPGAVAVDVAGNSYVISGGAVRKISPTGTATTLSDKTSACESSTGGTGSAPTICSPVNIAVDRMGTVYVAQTSSNTNPIIKITPDGAVSTFVKKASVGPTTTPSIFGGTLSYYQAVHLAVDSAGMLYAADSNDHVIRRYAPDGQSTVVSGTPLLFNEGDTDGVAWEAKFRTFRAAAMDAADRLHVLGNDNAGLPTIRRIESDGAVTTLLRAQSCDVRGGNASGAVGTLCTASQMAVKANGDFLVVETSATGNLLRYKQLRSYTRQGTSTLVAGAPSAEGTDDGQGSSARFDRPGALAFNTSGALYVRDNGNNAIRTVQADGLVRTLGKPDGHCTAVTGRASDFMNLSPDNYGPVRSNDGPLATDSSGTLYTVNNALVLKMKNCEVTLVADLKPLLDKPFTPMSSTASGIAADSKGNIFVSTLKSAIFKIDTKGDITVFAGTVGTLGHADGPGTSAQFSAPGYMTIDAADNLYVVDGFASTVPVVGPTIRKITPAGVVSTLAGNPSVAPGHADGAGAAAVFSVGNTTPGNTASLAVDTKGNVYVTDPVNSVIRKISADGQVSTPIGQLWKYGFVAGNLPGMINSPTGIAVRGAKLYISVPNAVLQVDLP